MSLRDRWLMVLFVGILAAIGGGLWWNWADDKRRVCAATGDLIGGLTGSRYGAPDCPSELPGIVLLVTGGIVAAAAGIALLALMTRPRPGPPAPGYWMAPDGSWHPPQQT